MKIEYRLPLLAVKSVKAAKCFYCGLFDQAITSVTSHASYNIFAGAW